MKTLKLNNKLSVLIILSIQMTLSSCAQMSEQIKDVSAGINGGFEESKNGIPVNWVVYTPNTVPDADFKIVLDKEVFKEGKQSLRFDVAKCSSIGGWKSPGITSEFFTIGKYSGEGRYKLSFWIKNDGTKFKIDAGGVEAMEGNMTTLIEDKEQISDWKFFEYYIDIPKDRWLRMELNILHPGTFWIDDIQIEKE